MGRKSTYLWTFLQEWRPDVWRLVMRLGKPLEHLQAALRAAQNTDHFGEQITTIGRQLAYTGYLAYDSIIWVSPLVPTFYAPIWNIDPGD